MSTTAIIEMASKITTTKIIISIKDVLLLYSQACCSLQFALPDRHTTLQLFKSVHSLLRVSFFGHFSGSQSVQFQFGVQAVAHV